MFIQNFQFYAFVDLDPNGIEMLLVYTFGSINMSHDRMGMAVSTIKRLFLIAEDLKKLKISDAYFSNIT